MKNLKVIIIVSIASLACQALTLKEKKQYNTWIENLNSRIALVKEKCGITVKVTLDEKFTTPFMEANTDPGSYCEEALSAIAGMCDDKLAKPMIAKNIKTISCVPGAKEVASFKLADGNLKFTYGLGASNLSQKTQEYLENNLK